MLLSSEQTKALKEACPKYHELCEQTGEHNSIEFAQAAIALYKLVQQEWEQSIADQIAENNKIAVEKRAEKGGEKGKKGRKKDNKWNRRKKQKNICKLDGGSDSS